eukprot:m.210725 g.210725  ORF g.210725 m.210725 type:complete len:449 (-) comp26130_c0_seq14:61-1407(-)
MFYSQLAAFLVSMSDERTAPTKRKSSASKQPRKKNRTAEHEEMEKPVAYLEKGLRRVRPYHFIFRTFAKGRWLRRPILEVLTKEFQSETPEYYKNAIESGRITINDEVISSDYKFKDNDVMAHRLHRHEPPVVASDLPVILETDELVVLDKPSSVPVHPCGRFRHNTILHMLSQQRPNQPLFTCHRLDRLTSGLLLVAKNKGTARKLEEQISNRDVQKEYLCRVWGRFPSEPIVCTEPILTSCHKLGICRVSAEGKQSETRFELVHADEKTSVVKCLPRTGRMHQIRVHLQHLGHPVLADPVYSIPAWGSDLGKRNFRPSAELIASVQRELTETLDSRDKKSEIRDIANLSTEELKYFDKDCSECTIQRPDPAPEELFLFLHALKYSGPDWTYSSPVPSWSHPEWEENLTSLPQRLKFLLSCPHFSESNEQSSSSLVQEEKCNEEKGE